MKYSTDTIIQILDEYQNNPSKFKTADDLFQFDYCKNLINEISYTTTCHAETIDDFIDVLSDLRDANDKFHSLFPNSRPIGEILHWWNPEKYYYEDEFSRFHGMITLTDSDIIDYKNLSDQCSHLVYDILYNDSLGNESPAHNVVAKYYNAYNTMIARRVALKRWEIIFQGIIDKIASIKMLYQIDNFRVYIPFLEDYEETANNIIILFEEAKNTANLLYEYDPYPAPLESPNAYNAFEGVREALENWMIWLDSEGHDHKGACAIADELTRRGYRPNHKIQTPACNYRSYFIGKNSLEKPELTDNSKGNEKPVSDSLIVKCGVLYYMLKSHINQKLIHKVAHFAFKRDESKFDGHNCKDSSYSYISHPERFTGKNAIQERIKEILAEYRFTDTEIEELLK